MNDDTPEFNQLKELKAIGWNKLNLEQRKEWQRLKIVIEGQYANAKNPTPKAEEEKVIVKKPNMVMTNETAIKELSSCLYSIVAILGKYLRINAGAAGMSEQQLRDLISRVENINKTLNG